jgi:hypothetical protein
MVSFRMKWLFRHRLLFLCAVGFALACTRMQAQWMSPTFQEFNKKARGTVEVNNTGGIPNIVSCKAEGFDVDEHGRIQRHSVDPALHVRFAAERVELPPKGSRQISFDANPATVPAWFVVTCTFSPVVPESGVKINMAIYSVVIVHGGPLDPRDVAVSAKHVGAKVEVEVKNNGPGLARVSSGEVLGHKKQANIGTFILFPHQRRLVEADWKETAMPETVRIQIGKKRLEAPVN